MPKIKDQKKDGKKLPELRFPGFEGGWVKKHLKETGTFIGGGTPSKKETAYWQGKTPWISSSDISEADFNVTPTRFITKEAIKNSATKIIPPKSILIVSRVGVGKIGIAEEGICTSQDFTNLIPNNNHNTSYLAYLLKKKAPQLLNFHQGTSIKGFSKKDIENLQVRIPSLTEQQKIADFLTAVDEWIENLKAQKQKLEAYKKGIMQKIFTRQIRFKDDNSNDFPNWEEKRLGEMGNFFRGHSYNRTNVKKKGLLVLRSSNIQNQRLIINKDLQFVNKDCDEKIILKKDDIVICMANGSKKLVGKSGTYLGDYSGKVTVGAFCSIYRSKIRLAKYFFQTIKYKKYLHLSLAGTNINNLKNSDLEKVKFNIPSSKTEIQKINAVLMTIDKIIQSKQNQIKKANKWKEGLLQRLLV